MYNILCRGLVKWYDRGLQNLWWEFDSLIPCTLGAWKSIKGFQALLFCPKRVNLSQRIFPLASRYSSSTRENTIYIIKKKYWQIFRIFISYNGIFIICKQPKWNIYWRKIRRVTMTEEEKLWTGGIDKKIFWFGRARCVFVSRIYVWQRPKYSCGRSENILE